MRLATGGMIDRETELTFRFDGRILKAHPGDTVASALLAADIKLVGRSFKYHRPRGLLTAGSEEPNALVTVGRGAGREPNVRATVQEVWDGLQVHSQNRWPALSLDVLSVNDLAAPFFGAGFYYKTFMWPRKAWEAVYEPFIRRAAGLGALHRQPAEIDDEKAFAFCDLLVIGGGPAGLMAALAAGRAGAKVILAEEEAALGGRLLAEREHVGGQPGADWAAEIAAELETMPNVRIMTRTAVTGAYDGGTYGALERVGAHLAPAEHRPRYAFWRIATKRAVLAAGALERAMTFPGNDRPGVMMAGAMRAYLNRWAVTPGKEVAIFGTGAGARATAEQLLDAGVTVTGLIDPDPEARDAPDYPVFSGGRILATYGQLGLNMVKVSHGLVEQNIRADALAMSGGWNPQVNLACHQGAKPRWEAGLAAYLPPEGAIPGMSYAGAVQGSFNTAACLAEGWRAGAEAAGDLGFSAPAPDLPEAEEEAWPGPSSWVFEGPGRAWLDFQNDVTVKDVKQSAQEGFSAPEHMKRYSTQGMATDQGKMSNVNALSVLAAAIGHPDGPAGTTTYRPPFVPVPISAMGAGARGEGFAPVRRTSSDAAVRARGAPMVEAGLWYRASYFPHGGETGWQQACEREVRMVRYKVGVSDVSTLGKIDVQGPDAAAFLDFVYTGAMSTLKPGRVRYGLMLREDGMVMDDGTCARLGESHYLITTTTAAAGQVMRHFDFVSQVLRPDLDASYTSVTEAWAQFAVAGPQARALLRTLVEERELLEIPFMGVAPVTVMGVEGRLFRISFSGELGFEIAVPVARGAALWRLMVAQAESLGGGAYGMEALNVLRIEKGFLTHAEIDGRATAYDVGLQGMMSIKKDFIGRAAASRPGLLDPNRERMIGLKPVDGAALHAGGFLFARGAAAERVNAEGYVTSACHSPTLGRDIALAFLRNGPERLGEVVRFVDHLRGTEALCLVCDPVFFDQSGGRMRA
ncbi:sarcosine oxidase subunit alpha family protein [Pseudoroseicyclus sp. H15]